MYYRVSLAIARHGMLKHRWADAVEMDAPLEACDTIHLRTRFWLLIERSRLVTPSVSRTHISVTAIWGVPTDLCRAKRSRASFLSITAVSSMSLVWQLVGGFSLWHSRALGW